VRGAVSTSSAATSRIGSSRRAGHCRFFGGIFSAARPFASLWTRIHRTARSSLARRAGNRLIENALVPLRETISEAGVNRLALAIRSAAGVEALIWFTDVAGLSRDEAAGVMLWSARAILRSARADGFPAASERAESGR